MRALFTEAIGTFFLVLSYGLAVNQDVNLAAVSIGVTLMVMVYAGAPHSGAHYNPAVSLGLTLSGALPARRLAPYWCAQFAAAILASLLALKFTGDPLIVHPYAKATWQKVMAGELLGTFALVYVVLHVATGRGRAGNGYYGFAIGGTVMALAIGIGPITGGSFNPAIGFATAAVTLWLGADHQVAPWIYLAGPCAGAALAAVAFRYQEGGNDAAPAAKPS
ncbi:MAG: aquaporin [Gemmatimonadaceae bacterium]|nr:aquaporin [Gemmatimonadaceae bacterium]